MRDNLEKIIGMVYAKWKKNRAIGSDSHPSEEALVGFLENRLSASCARDIRKHLLACEACAERAAVYLKADTLEDKDATLELISKAQGLVVGRGESVVIDILIRLKEKALEVLSTTGDILVGQEFIPAPLLRSRNIGDFKDEVDILKDFANIRIKAKIENKGGKIFAVTVMILDKLTQKIIKDLRVALVRDELELESYLADLGKVTFDNIMLGKYSIEIASPEKRIAKIILEVKS